VYEPIPHFDGTVSRPLKLVDDDLLKNLDVKFDESQIKKRTD
jgi:hypothetical protein